VPASALEHLQQARAAASEEDRLRHLVAAWRAKPAAELATVIVTLGAELDRARPRLTGKDKDARLSRWLELQKDHDDVLTGWLLEHSFIGDLHRYQDPSMRKLPRWAPDPRLTDALLARLAPRQYVTINSWAPLWAALQASRDPRVLAWLESWLTQPDLPAPRKRAAERVVAALEAAFPGGAPQLAADERALLESAGSSTRSAASEDELLAAIWAAPGDDGPRLVYADFLQERGDPRGEFIALQCRPRLDAASRKRVSALKNEHAARWLGPLAPAVLEQKTIAFERGFLALCTVCVSWGFHIDDLDDPRERAIRALSDHPAWATLREVRMAKLGKRTRGPLIAHLELLGVTVTLS